MASRKRRVNNVRSVSAKEVSVLAWIQDAYGNVLLVQQKAGKQLWSLPGGKARSAEALKQALRRELKEEIGLTVVSAKVIDLFDRPLRSGLAVLFQTKLRKGRLKLGANEIKNAVFADKLPPQATPSVRYFWKRQFPVVSDRKNILDL
ncbi:MAG: NUDIX hydrolase [Methylacidiphilales bacterium]|nr:NUDIX hydrolase [Candidatus Methylacidiphilales bacterium]